ncbi:50S ribosomal protein L24 [Enterobacteriaceae endosymbiont of Donacia bicoloricornis]|uniref:50S ribosomal protein L24 n=1 Tax=Enterobacteriaceae endosymbiont of Donacia bicoloricornis TaxID=2675772 RepID=UPI001449D4D9|nr:50S ribosomal protein L24 [Enterobacteriaceae endosymbiont of Donacia bicoloricornis]QJC37785.1 50S ribosomal protein L24 [Enterobacteriaceae endosymbiont of Donacia bicoloricornis]
MIHKFRCNDEVIILAGKDKGKKGKIKFFIKKELVIIKGINIVKKHSKPNPAISHTGGILEKEAGIHISNIAIFNKNTGKADRIKIKNNKGIKKRFFRSNNKNIK